MYARVALAAVIALLFGLAGTTAAKPKPAEKPAGTLLAGTITRASEKTITVKAELGNNTVEHDGATAVVVDGAAAKWADLKVGQQVRVTWDVSTGIARRVEVGVPATAPADDAPKKKKRKD